MQATDGAEGDQSSRPVGHIAQRLTGGDRLIPPRACRIRRRTKRRPYDFALQHRLRWHLSTHCEWHSAWRLSHYQRLRLIAHPAGCDGPSCLREARLRPQRAALLKRSRTFPGGKTPHDAASSDVSVSAGIQACSASSTAAALLRNPLPSCCLPPARCESPKCEIWRWWSGTGISLLEPAHQLNTSTNPSKYEPALHSTQSIGLRPRFDSSDELLLPLRRQSSTSTHIDSTVACRE